MSPRRLLLVTVIVAAGAAWVVATGGGAPPPLRFDASPTEATSSAGASVTYHIKAYDPASGDPISATCSGGSASGGGTGDFNVTSVFPVGSSTVHCDATLGNGDPVSDDFTVTVTDKTPPVVGSVASISESTTSATGKPVSYVTPTATDLVDGNVAVGCNPPSGSNFAVQVTTVTCTATDSHMNTGSSSFTVTVTFTDTEAPSLTVPTNITVNTSGTGAVVTYSVSATDNSGNPPVVSCNPPSGSTFPVGTTTVNCTASDGVNPPATASFTVTVVFVDTTGPTFSNVPSNQTVEANGPAGSIVNYPTPTATDAAEGPKPVACAPASATTFPLGTTTVTCSASDSHGNTGTASFTVGVVDTTKPSLIVPRDRTVYAETPLGISAASHTVATFLAEASATDTVDGNPVVTHYVPEFFTVGVHVVAFTATDASGNSVSKTAVFEVLPMPPPGTPPLSIPPPRTAPPDVRSLKAEAGDTRVRLSWQRPDGVDHVVISRSLTVGGDAQVVYTGSAEVFTDRGVVNSLEYRYLVVSVDRDGETSAGVAAVALPKRTLLKAPKNGARIRKAPKLLWVANSEASYYNVQLFRGERKILSIWPVKASLLLKNKWRYQGRTYKLSPGVYRWHVWPGFGARKAVAYGEMLGFSTFQIVR